MAKQGCRLRDSKLFGGLLLGVAPLFAQGNGSFTEDDLLGDIPIVSAASRFEQRLEQAPASVTIIDRDLIVMSGAQTFVDIFRLVPGFQSYHVGNNRYGISYHGLGREFPNQIEVMVDGRSVYEALFSSVNWSTLGISLADIDHIEVIRGSNAAAQGSNAFLGSINIVTRKPVQDDGLMVAVTAGDLHTRDGLLRYSDRVQDLDYRLSLGYQENQGFPAVAEGAMDDGRQLASGNFVATYTPTVLDTVEVALGYAKDRIGWGDADHPDEFSLAKSFNSFQSGKWTRTGDNDNVYELHAYHNRFKTGNFEDLGPLYGLLGIDADTAQFLTGIEPIPAEIVALFSQMARLDSGPALSLLNQLNTQVYGGFGRLESERYDIQFQHNFRLSETFRGTWGMGSRYDGFSSHHPQSYDMDVDEISHRVFAHSEWQATARLTLNAGTMVEDSHVGVLVSPRVSANYQLSPRHSLRAAAARGNRAPSLLEAHENSVSRVGDVIFDILRIADPALKEEKLHSYELAYLHQMENPRLSLDVRFFNEKVTHVIDEVQEPTTPEVAIFGDRSLKYIENSGYWHFTGGEFQLNYHLSDATFLRLHYTNTDLDSKALIRRLPDVLYLSKDDRIARHSSGLLIGQRFGERISLSLNTYYQSGLRWEDGDSIDNFTRVDAQLAYSFQIGRSHGSIRLVAQNLGSDYSEFNTNNVFETRYFIAAQMELPE